MFCEVQCMTGGALLYWCVRYNWYLTHYLCDVWLEFFSIVVWGMWSCTLLLFEVWLASYPNVVWYEWCPTLLLFLWLEPYSIVVWSITIIVCEVLLFLCEMWLELNFIINRGMTGAYSIVGLYDRCPALLLCCMTDALLYYCRCDRSPTLLLCQ